jgi:hypothetical protein
MALAIFFSIAFPEYWPDPFEYSCSIRGMPLPGNSLFSVNHPETVPLYLDIVKIIEDNLDIVKMLPP